LFNCVWTILVLVYVGLIPLYYEPLFHKVVSLALLAVTVLFWFAGSIAYSVPWPTQNCVGNNFCQTGKAGAAFGWFIWGTIVGLLVFDVIDIIRSRNRPVTAGDKSEVVV
jgi:hypothetical protein